MKKSNSIPVLILFALTFFYYSCGGDKKRTAADNRLGTIDVEIPASLRNKPEVVT